MFSLEDKEREATGVGGEGVGGWGVEEERKDKLCMPRVSIVRPGVLFRASLLPPELRPEQVHRA